MKIAVVLSVAAAVVNAKIASSVLRALEVKSEASVTVVYNAPNLNALKESSSVRDSVNDALVANLASQKGHTESTSVLDSAKCKSFPIGSVVLCDGLTKEEINQIAASPNVKEVGARRKFKLTKAFKKEEADVNAPSDKEPQWGVQTIGAPAIWKYFKGKGVVVGSIDTGAAYQHVAIKDNWRNNKGWFNPYNGTAVEKPIDSDQHGTHTIGTMVGKYGIGVAPEAQWISCLGLYGEEGTDEALLSCAQFMLCPTRLDGTHPECKLGADVINNSWGSDEGYNPWFENVITAWRAAGITPVFANGNAGPKCQTTGNPGGYERLISVGAIGSFNNTPTQLAYFSSKGPYDVRDLQTNKTKTLIKPDVSAPGFYTLSADATTTDGYMQMAGTSMAAPHVAGVVALLKSAQSDLTYEEIYSYVTKTADRDVLEPEPQYWYFKNGTIRAPGAPNCGGVSDKSWPNNRYGYGRVNVGTILRDGKLNDTPTQKPTTTVVTPAPTSTTTSAPVTPAPTSTTPCPTDVTPKPTTTSAPVTPAVTTTTPCPTDVTPKPTSSPVTTTPCPTDVTPKPTSTSAPVTTTPCPTDITPKPVTTTPCPTDVTPKPTSTSSPVTTTPCPTDITPKPATTTPCPTDVTPKPTSTSSPVTTTPCPTDITPKPATTTPCPTDITPKPATTTPCPTDVTPKPTSTSAPVTTTPCPTDITPKPVTTTPCPTDVTPKPTSTSAPVTTTPCPTDVTPKPTSTSAPVTTTPCPTDVTPKPTTTAAPVTPAPTTTTVAPSTPAPTTTKTTTTSAPYTTTKAPTTTKSTTTKKPTTTKPSKCAKVEEGVDYYGHDITRTQRANHEDCCEDCAKTPGCVVYVWTPWNDGTCFLKWKAGKSTPYWGAKAAKKPYTGPTCEEPEENTDYYGNDILETFGAKEDCCALCLTRDDCVGYSHYNGVCSLKGKLGYATKKDGVTSAARSQ